MPSALFLVFQFLYILSPGHLRCLNPFGCRYGGRYRAYRYIYFWHRTRSTEPDQQNLLDRMGIADKMKRRPQVVIFVYSRLYLTALHVAATGHLLHGRAAPRAHPAAQFRGLKHAALLPLELKPELTPDHFPILFIAFRYVNQGINSPLFLSLLDSQGSSGASLLFLAPPASNFSIVLSLYFRALKYT